MPASSAISEKEKLDLSGYFSESRKKAVIIFSRVSLVIAVILLVSQYVA